jgi:sodium-coupled monocarboxylate transporter 8/12
MIGAVTIVMILGTLQVGGIANVFQIAEEGGRLMWFK